ncbi:uncharacterized protein LOC128134288 [Lactuca sativa]|uniref:uncharacterized protein LOC128134288 n=1 Tax=Lactuca sativa TaxID=4236 RepID=UPI0022AEFC6B|nr:uncharacterized protein LOC128134288 [Lactuca sativa]
MKAAQAFAQTNNLDKEMDECIEKLKALEWGNSDPKYITALMLFAKNPGYIWIRKKKRIERIKANESEEIGHAYTQDLIHGDPIQCFDMIRLSQYAFVLLCNHFTQRNWLQHSRTISVEEKITIFLHVVGHNECFRAVKERFHHSIQTIHQCFHEVLKAMMCFAREIIVPTSSNTTKNTSECYRRLKNIFPGALGALDGTLVHAVVPIDEQTRYRGRGKDKYYLCDAAYTNTRGFMAPYRNTRYWLADFRRNRALTKEERLNHAHAQLRNFIERAYGVLKARFPILKRMAPYPFPVQRDIVIACVAVHNFIKKYDIENDLFTSFEQNNMVTPNVGGGGSEGQNIQGIEWGSEAVEYMTTLRDQIAN